MILIIDSTEYKQDRGLNKENISSIKALGREGLIFLHIPWFVYKETSTACIDDLKKELNTFQRKLKSFDRKGVDTNGFNAAMGLAEATKKLFNELEKSNETLWYEFIKESKATLHQYSSADSIKVFEAYFSGEKPFKSLKKREDIPDAFIYMTITQLAKDNKVHFVSGDKNLGEKCNANPNIILYESLREFIASEIYKEALKKYKEKLETQDKVSKILTAKEIIINNIDSIKDAVFKYTNQVTYLEFTDPSLMSDNNEGAIWAIDDPKTKVETTEIQFIDDKFFVPITVKATASIDYAVFKGDYWAEHGSIPPLNIANELNKHYYQIEDVVEMELKKTLVIKIEDLDEDEDLDISIDEFDSLKILE
ncbi:PIN domain-containing protein [Aureispira anguillae]|uniref:PIN domain-containing protein n=1 Tax=Aureispira anguillae TaxID=2864201 RepID=A0A915YHB1_9BACT|nr:PIN domain-containing protein [Aureispira anguillae]BDS13009.1 PIN domain-containing protein [Aureispira anguillae]